MERMSPASRLVNAAYIRSALEVKAQRDELLRALQLVLDNETTSNRIAATQIARRLIKKAKKWK